MRSVVIEGPGQVSVNQVPDAVLPSPDGAVVRVEAAAICGSDLHFYDGDLPLFPVAVGHEAVGTVVEVGPDVGSVALGDRVLVSSVAGCGRCRGCARRDPVQCELGPQVFGSGALGGAQGELLAVPAADFQLLRVPEGVDTHAALLLTDNLATGWAGVRRADVGPEDTLVVLGLGAVGQCAVRSALAAGVGRVLVHDPVPGRVALATAAGATALTSGTVEEVKDLTGGVGADAALDAVARDETLDLAFGAVRSGGTVSVVGIHDLDPYPLPVLMGVFRSLTLRMTTAPVQQTWPELVPLLQEGRLDTSGLFTHTFALDDATAAYAAVAARSGDCLKAVLVP